MGSHRTCTPEQFGSTLVAIIDEYARKIDSAVLRDVDHASMVAWNTLVLTSPRDSGMYAGGWMRDLDVSSEHVVATIYQSRKPSLTHLLEKDHAMLVGRTNRYGMKKYIGQSTPEPHIEPAGARGAEDLARRVGL